MAKQKLMLFRRKDRSPAPTGSDPATVIRPTPLKQSLSPSDETGVSLFSKAEKRYQRMQAGSGLVHSPVPLNLSHTTHTVPSARNIWDDAYTQFQADHPGLLDKYEAFLTKSAAKTTSKTDPAIPAIRTRSGRDRVIQLLGVLEKEEEAIKNARWKFTCCKREIVVQQKIKQIAENVLVAKDLISAVAGIEPHAAIAWAGVSTLLPLLTNALEENEAAFDGLEYITTFLLRYRLIEERYFTSDNRVKGKTGVQGLEEKAREKTVRSYSQVFEYLIRLSIKHCRGAFINSMRGAFKIDGWTTFLSGLRTNIETTDQILQALDQDLFLATMDDIRQQQMNYFERVQVDMTIAKLEIAADASYDTSGPKDYRTAGHDDTELVCLAGTRTLLLGQIGKWIDNDTGSAILWLHGLAGTGKSTISRTVAQSLDQDGRLGASFFFKRGGGDRGNSAKFFSTIASQLSRRVPGLGNCIVETIEQNHSPSQLGSLQHQCTSLLSKPLSDKLRVHSKSGCIFIVIDAIDECEEERGPNSNAGRIIQLLAKLTDVPSFRLRVLITSRPSSEINHEFKDLSSSMPGLHQELDLGKEQKSTISNDIFIFLKHRFKQIRRGIDNVQGAEDWPGEVALHSLRDMAVPLFIFASTVCRYIMGRRSQAALESILENKDSRSFEALEDMYILIMNHYVNHPEPERRRMLIKEVQQIIGPIVLLADPLSKAAAARLLKIPMGELSASLADLASVFRISKDDQAPVQLYHLSFREFLLTRRFLLTGSENPFCVNEVTTHENLARHCLELLSELWTSPEPIYGQAQPATLRANVCNAEIRKFIPPEVAYACSYWVVHLKASTARLCDNDFVHDFLRSHFLQWMETLCWLGKSAILVDQLGALTSMIAGRDNIGSSTQVDKTETRYAEAQAGIWASLLLSCMASLAWLASLLFGIDDQQHSMPGSIPILAILQDAQRFVLRNRHVADLAPLQIYSSALMFTPDSSVIKTQFIENYKQKWPCITPKVLQGWGPEIQILEGHDNDINAVSFSHDGNTIASGSNDMTVRLWDANTGKETQKLEGHTDWVTDVAFSPHDKHMLASASRDKTIRLWNVNNGRQLRIPLEGHEGYVTAIAFSYERRILVSASQDKTLRLWDLETGEQIHCITGHTTWISAMGSSHAGLIAPVANNSSIHLWDMMSLTGATKKLEGHTGWVTAVAFSDSGQQVASGSPDGYVRIWNTTTGEQTQKFGGQNGWINALALSPNGMLAASSQDRTIGLWNPVSGQQINRFEGHDGLISTLDFSRDGRLVSGSSDKTIRLWDTGRQTEKLEGHRVKDKASDLGVFTVAFSFNGHLAASASNDKTVLIWDTNTGEVVQKLLGCPQYVTAMAFSTEDVLAMVSLEESIELWDVTTNRRMQTLKGHSKSAEALTFSSDGQLIASGSADKTIRLWDVKTGKQMLEIDGHDGTVTAVAFAQNGCILASGSYDRTVRLWDVKTGKQIMKFEGHDKAVTAVAFSHDGCTIASGSYDNTVRLWEIKTVKEMQRHTGFARTLEFSKDDKALITDARTFAIEGSTLGLRGSDLTEGLDRMEVNLGDTWLKFRGENILWLPQEHRGSCLAVCGSTLAIGQRSGTVSFFKM